MTTSIQIPDHSTPFCGKLTQWSILRFRGEDSVKLLQGQFSCDVSQVNDTHSELGNCCNPKGRIIANFLLSYWQGDYYLLLPKSSCDVLSAHLKKYMVFYKCTLEDVSEQLHLFALSSSDLLIADILSHKQSASTASCHLFAHDAFSQHCLVLSTEETLPLIKSASPITDAQWQLLNINKGIPFVCADNSGELLPHYLNQVQLSGINFKKGCYTGQEIIARMHYRGTIKRHTYPVSIQSEATIQIGMPILEELSQKVAGHIVNLVAIDNTHYTALVEMADEYANSSLVLADIVSHIQVGQLPFNL